jgi:hypothetical protein
MEVSFHLNAPADFPQGYSSRYPLDRRLCGPQSRSGIGGEEKNPCPCLESYLGRQARSLVSVLTELRVQIIQEQRLKTGQRPDELVSNGNALRHDQVIDSTWLDACCILLRIIAPRVNVYLRSRGTVSQNINFNNTAQR